MLLVGTVKPKTPESFLDSRFSRVPVPIRLTLASGAKIAFSSNRESRSSWERDRKIED